MFIKVNEGLLNLNQVTFFYRKGRTMICYLTSDDSPPYRQSFPTEEDRDKRFDELEKRLCERYWVFNSTVPEWEPSEMVPLPFIPRK